MNVATRDEEQSLTSSADLLGQAGIIIPTYDAAKYWPRLHASLERQGIARDQVLVVDSSSQDETRDLVRDAGYGLKIIAKDSFRHGETRQTAAKYLPAASILVYLTQDALPLGSECFAKLLSGFENQQVGAIYGRQVAREQANAIERHARLFNYPDRSELRDFSARERMGFRTAFFSNSFAAYRRSALEDVGGFTNTIVSEEVSVAARMLLQGWSVRYEAEALAVHSHGFTIGQEFSRYFDIGVHHGRERWVIEKFGSLGGEGLHFVQSEMRYLRENDPGLIPLAMVRNASKWLSYKLGAHERFLPRAVKEAISGQPNFWRDEEHDLRSAGSQAVTHPSA